MDLKLVAFTRVLESLRLNPPEIVDPGVVAFRAESRPKEIARKNQPGLLVLERLLAILEALEQRRPERTNQEIVPISFLFAEDLLKALQKIRGRDFVTPVERPGEEGRDASARCDELPRIDTGRCADHFPIIL